MLRKHLEPLPPEGVLMKKKDIPSRSSLQNLLVDFEVLCMEPLLYSFLKIPYIFWMVSQPIEYLVTFVFVWDFKADVHKSVHLHGVPLLI